MTNFACIIETSARDIARQIIAVGDWAGDLAGTIAAIRDTIHVIASANANTIAVEICDRVADRTEAILRDVASADIEVIIADYFDLLPDDLDAKLTARAVEWLKKAGVTAEQFKDDDGTTFLRLANVQALGIDPAELERFAARSSAPVGSLHRVQ